MKEWTTGYHNQLKGRFTSLKNDVPTRLAQITDARTVPSLDGMTMGSAKRVTAAALFFDIVGFTRRCISENETDMKRTLRMLNCVIPTITGIIHDHGGYIEKNTGDGVMALFVAETSNEQAVTAALDAAVTSFYALRAFVNPYLTSQGISAVDARIGIDFGPLLISKIGVPTGSDDHSRNFLTAVGPIANVACRLQEHAGTNQIWVGDRVRYYTPESRGYFFYPASIPDWTWIYLPSGLSYPVWHFVEVREAPMDFAALLAALSEVPASR